MITDGLNNDTNLNEKETDTDLNALYSAVQSGNTDDLSRLMAADVKEVAEPEEKEDKEGPAPTKEEEDDTTSTETVEKKDEKDESKSDDKDSDKSPEAAPSAASTDDAVDEVTRLKSEIADLKQQSHRYQSDAGRVPFLQRRLAELEKQARAPARTTTNVPAKTSFTAEDYKNVELDPDTQKEIDDLKEVDPVLAKVVERSTKTAILTAQSRMESVFSEREREQQEYEDQRFYQEQKAELSRTIPNHEEVFRSREWQEWKAGLTPGQRALAESGYASEVVQAIYAFAADIKARNPQLQDKAAPEKESSNSPEKPASEVAEARARKASAGPASKSPSAKRVEEFDEEAFFKQQYNEIGKKEHILK